MQKEAIVRGAGKHLLLIMGWVSTEAVYIANHNSVFRNSGMLVALITIYLGQKLSRS